ncbi:MAG: efflux RND transporter periplasmic adaptor subunit [Fimbriiglobus sp.]|jgi:multidrug resistance efflux pump|nr:efflux RND transporter periplasmic adaptor subunit [Fimbriiglobus sp.]
MTDHDDPVALESPAPPVVNMPPPPDGPRAARSGTPPATDDDLRDRVKKLRISGQGGSGGGGGKGAFLGRVAWLPWLLCGVLALAWAGVAIRTYKMTPAREEGGTVVGTPPPGGAGTTPAANTNTNANAGGSAPASVAPGTIRWEGKGTLVTARQISVSPIDVGGKVIELYGPGVKVRPEPGSARPADTARREFEEGALYQKGDIIAILDSAAYLAQVNEAKASLASAEQRLAAAEQRRDAQLPASVRKIELDQVEAQLKEAQANKVRADQELERQQRLGTSAAIKERQQAEADAVTSAARVRNLEATLVILKEGPRKEQLAALEADVKGAQADVAAASARLVQAQWRLDNCTIKAPITGTVLTKSAEVGKLVNPMAFSGGGAICDLADLAELEAELKVAEREIAKVRVGMACTIRPDAYQDRIYTGVVHRIMPIANRADNTVNVRVRVKLKDGEVPGTFLKPEMGAVVSIRE